MKDNKYMEPQAKERLAKLRMEVSEEPAKEITSRQSGNMVKKMVEAYKEKLK